MKITEKIKIGMVLAISILFANNSNAQTASSPNYDQGFRLGIGVTEGYAVTLLINQH